MRWIGGLLGLVLLGCSPSSKEDFRQEGQRLCKGLVKELSAIETSDDLVKSAPEIKKYFEKMVDVMIEARKLGIENGDEEETLRQMEDNSYSEWLCFELRRIYSLEKGRETIEKVQREAMLRLDAYARTKEKQQQHLRKQ